MLSHVNVSLRSKEHDLHHTSTLLPHHGEAVLATVVLFNRSNINQHPLPPPAVTVLLHLSYLLLLVLRYISRGTVVLLHY